MSDFVNLIVNEAVELVGSKTQLARLLKVRLNTVLDWTRGAKPSPVNMYRLKKIVRTYRNGKN